MLAKTTFCMALVKPPLATMMSNLAKTRNGQIMRPMICHHLLSLRQRHEAFPDNASGNPSDHSKAKIDDILEGFGDRGIRRNGHEISVQDIFKLFQLENKFLISETKLHREMVRLQRALHPDKYIQTDATSKIVSDKLSAIVNQAFGTLKNPYKRALYLLRVRTGKTEIEIEKKLDDLKVDPKFLSKMMETRERIDLDRGEPPEKMKLAMELQTALDGLILDTNRDFEREDYDNVIENLAYMKFLANCHAALADKLGEFSKF